jgi:ribosomal protein S12
MPLDRRQPNMSIRKLVRIRPVAALIAAAATVLFTGYVGGAATAPGDAGIVVISQGRIEQIGLPMSCMTTRTQSS